MSNNAMAQGLETVKKFDPNAEFCNENFLGDYISSSLKTLEFPPETRRIMLSLGFGDSLDRWFIVEVKKDGK